ncbi:hypothetical protein [Limnofasciculus baicalensis]|uniref:Uncharacterized protein n=1 Tax=Limnofasciculus baicalensis BBK-W-15 TaxID=2699891 RepID=A0AAE3KQM8_9CYAN|nr:hypothetical protein [Limnofasciculus baicalensis]MCP2730843.1 hypothetical protein [Limnofasciculus baicalensis BBK-W-15]
MITIEPFSTAISSRLASLSNPEDLSYQTRLGGYGKFLAIALFQYLGKGLGNNVDFGMGGNDKRNIKSCRTLLRMVQDLN